MQSHDKLYIVQMGGQFVQSSYQGVTRLRYFKTRTAAMQYIRSQERDAKIFCISEYADVSFTRQVQGKVILK